MSAVRDELIERNVSLLRFNTFGVEARAALFARVRSLDELQRVLADPRVAAVPRLVLGGGSNLLFTRDFEGCVLKIEIAGSSTSDDGTHWLVNVGAGENWHATVERLLNEGLHGLENLALIPGSIGAAPIQNIGAYGVELAERFDSLQACNADDGTLHTMTADDCRFGYRDSVFKHSACARIIVGVTLALPRRWNAVTRYADVESELRARGVTRPAPQDIFDAVVAIRQRKLPDPAQIGNAGSFFKNPVVSRQRRTELIERYPSMVSYDLGGGRYKLAAAWLIEACGLKGAARGRAAVHEKQALVLVNRGGATGAEIMALASEVHDAVQARFDIDLEREPQVV